VSQGSDVPSDDRSLFPASLPFSSLLSSDG
jgi:hypothetical protein